jgi:hypothetical protein
MIVKNVLGGKFNPRTRIGLRFNFAIQKKVHEYARIGFPIFVAMIFQRLHHRLL